MQPATPYSTHPSLIRPYLVLTVGVLAASTASILIVQALHEASPLVVAAYRLTLATLVLAPLAWRRGQVEWRGLDGRDWGWIAASGVFLGLHFATWISSLAFTSVASSAVLVALNPLFVALLSAVLLGERLSRLGTIGLSVALIGAILISVGDLCGLQGTLLRQGLEPLLYMLQCSSITAKTQAGNELLGDGLALTGAIMVAAYLMIGRHVRGKLSLVPYIFVVYGVAALVLIAAALASGQALTGFRPITYGYFVLLALFPQLVGHSSFNYALKYLPATSVAIVALGEPISSTALALVLLGQVPTLLTLFGGGLILAGIYAVLRAGTAGSPGMEHSKPSISGEGKS
jgi:drug/metabolite transporter (DMT)-like permease